MADVSSKNMYALLGNDPEQDSDREPEPPTKAIDKPAARSGKRTGPEAAPAKATHTERGGRGGGRARYTGSEAAYQRGVDSNGNRRQGIPDDVNVDRRTRGRGGGRLRRADGHQGPRGHRDDRHSRGLPDHPKQGDLAWGANTGEAELKDEQAGDALANQDAKQENADRGPDGPVDADGNVLGDDEDEEEKQKSYAEYLAEQAAKKLNLGGSLSARKANEGSKENKKWASAKAINKEDEEENYITPSASKSKRERLVKERNVLEIDHSWNESSRGDRGGRGRGRGEYRGDRGGRGGRGDRGDRDDRGERGERGGRGRGRGEYRGEHRGEHRGGRGAPRGGASAAASGSQLNTSDQSAFPSLGA